MPATKMFIKGSSREVLKDLPEGLFNRLSRNMHIYGTVDAAPSVNAGEL